jgi:hypothetical protein
MAHRLLAVLTVAAAVAGCGRGTASSPADGGANGDGVSKAEVKTEATDAKTDQTSEPTSDAAPDAPPDVLAGTSDGRPDVSPDATREDSDVAKVDVPADVSADSLDAYSDGSRAEVTFGSEVNLDRPPVPDARPDSSVDGVTSSDLRGEAGGAPAVPCSGDPSTPVWDSTYRCGICESDMFYPLVCVDGHFACATSYVGNSGAVITVPSGLYVVNLSDVMSRTGQCAYLAPMGYPGFVLENPSSLTSSRDPLLPLTLRAVSASSQVRPTFDWLRSDRTNAERAIRTLVTLTDMTKGAPVEYSIGEPVMNSSSETESVALQPTSLVANNWYRVTVFPAETQQLIHCHTYTRDSSSWLTQPETTDFYTYSRPMVGTMAVVAKDGAKGYVTFNFTESLVAGDLAANPTATIAVDGVMLSGCPQPYACSGSTSARTGVIRLDLQTIPTAFTAITLRIPHAIKSVNGGTIRDGTLDNPHAKIDGDWAVYTFEAKDMVSADDGTTMRWNHVGM